MLPWREEPTPYRVWVSEIMLQQTRVEAVKPYFERFTKRLPDVKALAECLLQPRAEYAEGSHSGDGRYGGKLPADYEELLKLKGIGLHRRGNRLHCIWDTGACGRRKCAADLDAWRLMIPTS